MSAEVQKISTEEQYEAAIQQIQDLWDAEDPMRVGALLQLISMVYEYETRIPGLEVRSEVR